MRGKAGNSQPLSVLFDSIQLANLHLLFSTNRNLIGLMRRRQEFSFVFLWEGTWVLVGGLYIVRSLCEEVPENFALERIKGHREL